MLHRYLSVFLFLLSIIFMNSQAAANCFFYGVGNMTSTKIVNVPLSVTLSAPQGIAIGQTIYKQNITLQNISSLFIKCMAKGQFLFGYDYKITPFPLSSMNQVYKTNLAGIGIKFSSSGNDFPFRTNNSDCSNTTDCKYFNGWSAPSSFSLVKTADNVSAGTIIGSQLPTVLYQLGQESSMVNIYQLSITGQINITVPTCDISFASSNMYVPMGTTPISHFSGSGSGTDWHDASITLINCNPFFGNSSAGGSGGSFNGTSTTYSLTPNRAEVTLTPLNGIESAANGIMKIDDHPQKASGIGIQLSTTRSTSGKVDLSLPLPYSLPQDGSSTVTLPLYARYVQTESSVTAGKANGRLEYTIIYQ